jgi:hypothetical protein
MKKIIVIIAMILIAMPTAIGKTTSFYERENDRIVTNISGDFDPLVDISVTVKINKIRSLEKRDVQIPSNKKIDTNGNPDFYVKVIINEVEFTSPIWNDTKYVYDPQWSATLDVPDDKDFVYITIQLWDWNKNGDILCDISPFNYEFPDTYEVNLVYSIKTGQWTGDDYCTDEPSDFDLSGYGRLNGCDDGSIYQNEPDCELWFDIYQNDYDGDGIPYWTETERFHTDPTVDDRGRDDDRDGVPIEWEYKWGHSFGYRNEHSWFYDPFVWEDHATLDPDKDGLTNIIEYQMSEWGADPFRRDVFVELDVMESNVQGTVIDLPIASEELLYTAFNRQNVVFHLDSGSMGGSDIIPFDEQTDEDELQDIYTNYFLHGDENNSRRGVFHYGVMVYNAEGACGYIFRQDAFQISVKGMFDKKQQFPYLQINDIFASAYMHELGHTFNFNPIPGHSEDCYYIWQKGWWLVGSYKSCMNYRYMYYTVDYSDGSRGKNDFDDWERMDMTSFQRHWG